MGIWTNRIFWQRPEPVVGYISLTKALDTNCISVKQRIMVARKIVRIFHGLHAQNLIQKDFQADDIFVTEVNRVMHFTLKQSCKWPLFKLIFLTKRPLYCN